MRISILLSVIIAVLSIASFSNGETMSARKERLEMEARERAKFQETYDKCMAEKKPNQKCEEPAIGIRRAAQLRAQIAATAHEVALVSSQAIRGASSENERCVRVLAEVLKKRADSKNDSTVTLASGEVISPMAGSGLIGVYDGKKQYVYSDNGTRIEIGSDGTCNTSRSNNSGSSKRSLENVMRDAVQLGYTQSEVKPKTHELDFAPYDRRAERDSINQYCKAYLPAQAAAVPAGTVKPAGAVAPTAAEKE